MGGAVWKLEPVDGARRQDGKRRYPKEVPSSIEGFIDRHEKKPSRSHPGVAIVFPHMTRDLLPRPYPCPGAGFSHTASSGPLAAGVGGNDGVWSIAQVVQRTSTRYTK